MELRSANSMSMEMKMEYLATIFTPKFDAQVKKRFHLENNIYHKSKNPETQPMYNLFSDKYNGS